MFKGKHTWTFGEGPNVRVPEKVKLEKMVGAMQDTFIEDVKPRAMPVFIRRKCCRITDQFRQISEPDLTMSDLPELVYHPGYKSIKSEVLNGVVRVAYCYSYYCDIY